MKNNKYISDLENVIRQMLLPLRNIPFNVVIESLSNHRVIPFDFKNKNDKALLSILNNVAIDAGKLINQKGIISARPNEVGNYIEVFIKQVLSKYGLNPKTPSGKSGKKKSTGYPDILFFFEEKPSYLECKTYNAQNIDTTQRSFYFSPSSDFKVTYDAHHFLLAYEMWLSGRQKGKNVYRCKHWKLLSIENLLLDVKYEFNSDNRRIYSDDAGAVLLAEGNME